MIRYLTLRHLALVGILPLAACVSVLPEPDTADALYRISPAPMSATLTSRVVIREPEAPRLFAGNAIASEAADGSLRLIPRVEWADAATRMLQIALLDSLGTGAEDEGIALAASAGLRGDFELAWRVANFVVAGRQAHCQLELTLLDGRSRDVISRMRVTAQAEASGDGSRQRAQALAAAGQSCVRKAADYVAATAIPSSE